MLTGNRLDLNEDCVDLLPHAHMQKLSESVYVFLCECRTASAIMGNQNRNRVYRTMTYAAHKHTPL